MKKKENKVNKILDSSWTWFGIVFLAMMVIYLGMIQLWDLTSTTYKPVGLLDNVSRAPEDVDDWFIRREHGVCPYDFREFTIRDPFRGFRDC